jgi:hypothetical protein
MKIEKTFLDANTKGTDLRWFKLMYKDQDISNICSGIELLGYSKQSKALIKEIVRQVKE